MKKFKTNIIVIAFVFGWLIGLLDTILDYFIFYRGKTFFEIMITNVPAHETFMRIFILVSITGLGFIISYVVAKQEKIEEEMHEGEIKYRKLFESAGDAIFILELEGEHPGQIFATNQAAADMHGYTIEELTTMNISQLDSPLDVREIPRRIQKILRGGQLREEATHRRKDGTEFTVEINAGLLELKDKKYILAFDRDVSARKQAEDGLKESENRYKSLFNNVADAIFVHDLVGNIYDVNQVACNFLGFSRDELLEMNLKNIETAESAKQVAKEFERLLKEDHMVFQTELLTRAGGSLLVELSSRIVSHAGKLMVFTIARDISKRHRIEEALLKSEERYRILIETMNDGVSVLDNNGVITYVNKSFYDFLDYTKEEMIGKNTDDFLDEKNKELLLKQLIRHQAGFTESYELSILGKDGKPVTFITSPRLLKDSEGNVTGSFAVLTNITERKRADEALRESEERYRGIFESATDALMIISSEGVFVEANTAACELYGYSKEELIGLPGSDIINPGCCSWFGGFKENIDELGNFCAESIDTHKNSSKINVEVRGTSIIYKGTPHLLAVVRDITERKRTENEIVNLAKFPAENPNPVMRFSANGEILYSNHGSASILEVYQEYHVIQSKFHEHIKEALNSGRNLEVEMDCGDRVFSMTFAPVVDAEYVNVYALDITEIKLAERALQKSQALLTEQKLALEQKNFDLREILEQIELEKKKIQDDVLANVDKFLIPTVQKLKSLNQPIDEKYIEILQNNLEKLTSSFASKLSRVESKLAPKEIEICNLIRSGLTNKDMAKLLNISLRTVETHRQNIRKKLGIAHRDVNLAVYLQTL